MCKNIFGNVFVRALFSCVRMSYDLCAHAHSLEGTLISTSKRHGEFSHGKTAVNPAVMGMTITVLPQ